LADPSVVRGRDRPCAWGFKFVRQRVRTHRRSLDQAFDPVDCCEHRWVGAQGCDNCHKRALADPRGSIHCIRCEYPLPQSNCAKRLECAELAAAFAGVLAPGHECQPGMPGFSVTGKATPSCNAANCFVGAASRRQRIRSWKQIRGHGRIRQISNDSQ
jgi:hypothetical protein